MKKEWLTLSAICLLVGCQAQSTTTVSHSGNTQESAKTTVENMATDFTLKAVDGQTYRLSDFKGKKVYIKFWASWCSVCLAGLGNTNQLAAQFADDPDVVILSVVAPGYRNEQKMESFIEWYQGLELKDLPVLLDEGGKVMADYLVRGYPSVAFINREGQLVKSQPGHLSDQQVLDELANMP